MGHGEFLWSDLGAFGAEDLLDFYGSLFGWTYRTEKFPGGPNYHYADYRGDVAAGLSFWMSYIGVDDIEDAVSLAEKLGGRKVLGPATFGHGAAIAMIEDPTGTLFTLFDGQHLQPRPYKPRSGRAFWTELLTPDFKTSAAFYSGLFNWRIEQPNDKGLALVRNMAQSATASLREVTPRDTPKEVRWQVTFAVDKLEQARRVVQDGGGTVLDAADEVGRCLVSDPTGIQFNIAETRTRRGWFT